MAIYILKMSLLIHQLDLHWRTKKKIQQMKLFAVFVYLESWFTAGSLFSAASNDIKLYNRIQKFQVINKQVSVSSTAAKNISMLPSVEVENKKPVLPTLNKKSCLTDFVGTRSTLIFSLLEVPHSFLNDPEWTERQEYREARSSLQKLTPLNDSSERALALATRLNSNITRNEESYQELVHVVEEHRKKYGLKTKEDLRKFN